MPNWKVRARREETPSVMRAETDLVSRRNPTHDDSTVSEVGK